MIYAFGDYELDTQLYELRHVDKPCQLEPQAFNVLAYLLQHHDRVVTKQELLDRLWPEQYVGEATLSQRLMTVRKALGESGRSQRFIKTVHGRGYRFVAAVAERAGKAKRCPTCQRENGVEALYCVVCGNRLVHTCGHCGQVLPQPATFCPACGQSQGEVAAPPATPRAVTAPILHGIPAAERKPVTVLCAALADVPSVGERLGLDERHHLMRTLYECVQAEVRRYEGTIQHVASDHVLALFGAPLAQEDHAQRAVSVAIGLRQRLSESTNAAGLAPGATLAIRISLHTGPVAVGGIGATGEATAVVGDTLALATKLQEHAEPGTIICSEATARLVHGTADLEAIQPGHTITQPMFTTSYKVLGQRGRRAGIVLRGRRPLSPFVGRAQVLATLQALLTQAQDGRGQVVGIVGEAGMGKPRLLYEFHQRLAGKPLTYFEGHCLPYGSATPYLPVLDIVRQCCGITDVDRSEEITTKVQDCLREVGIDAVAWAPYVLHLLGNSEGTAPLAQLTPEAIKARTFEALRQLYRKAADSNPSLWLSRTCTGSTPPRKNTWPRWLSIWLGRRSCCC